MLPGLPVSSIPQCKSIRHGGACLQLIQTIGCFKSTFFDAHQALKMICKVMLLKSQIKTREFFEEIITSSNEVFKECESHMALRSRQLSNPARNPAESNDTAQHTVGSQILTLLLQAKNQICKILHAYL